MLFVSVKKYKELQIYKRWAEEYIAMYEKGYATLYEQNQRLQLLRTLDKECIQALLNITGVDTALGSYEKSLVDQTLNQ